VYLRGVSFRDAEDRRRKKARQRRVRIRAARFLAAGSLIAVVAVVLVAVIGSNSHNSKSRSAAAGEHASTTTTTSTAVCASAAGVPILSYHVINSRPASTSASSALYVPVDEFTSQMQALKTAGWHAVTMNQLEACWTHGQSLGPGKPIVISFNTGYASHYTNALPVLRGLGWVGVENLQLGGLSPTDGGLNNTQIRGLVAAGWELDTEGMATTDLLSLSSSELSSNVTTAKQDLHNLYGVPVNWFSYPSGRYDATLISAVRAAGYVGATTINPGWAAAQQDRFRLPRLTVRAGTSGTQLLAQIAAAQSQTSIPPSYTGPGLT
jgi:peptidoglycan/xylan/chitin deacetylase (PgdA/CDA1 family)